jgi:trehalose synthase
VSVVTIPPGPSLADGYRSVLGARALAVLEGLAGRLRGHRLVMVNSTATGGGVAEILHRLVRLLNELGVPTTWEVIAGTPRFHGITKSIHNALHGHPADLTDDDLDYFREWNREQAERLALDGDLVMVHDPQPVALAEHRRRPGQRWLWRCHIDLAHADPRVWHAMAPHVARYDAAVFSAAAFVPPLARPAYLAPPSIDPLSEKNVELDDADIAATLARLGLPRRTPLVTQVSRFDRLKDPLGVLEAFRLLRRREDAHLVLAGGRADDDPEGAAVLAEVRGRVGSARDVSILELPPDSHHDINAIQRASAVVLQKSLREGFALTVTEALWKRRAVVASAVGGIPLQVIHERTGLLVRSIEGTAYQVARLLRSADLRRRLGAEGHRHVRANFLHPREARDYLAVFVRLLEQAD